MSYLFVFLSLKRSEYLVIGLPFRFFLFCFVWFGGSSGREKLRREGPALTEALELRERD